MKQVTTRNTIFIYCKYLTSSRAHSNFLRPIDMTRVLGRLPKLGSIQRALVPRLTLHVLLPRRDPSLARLQPRRLERLVKVMRDVVDMLQAQTDTDHIRRDTPTDLLLVGDLLMRRPPWVDDERLRVPNVGEMRA